MNREVMERKLANLIAHYKASVREDYFVGSFKELKKHIIFNSYEWNHRKLYVCATISDDFNWFARGFAKENNLRTKEDWIAYLDYHHDLRYFSSEKKLFEYIFNSQNFKDHCELLTNEELIEESNMWLDSIIRTEK